MDSKPLFVDLHKVAGTFDPAGNVNPFPGHDTMDKNEKGV
jgi:hypothetical protein